MDSLDADTDETLSDFLAYFESTSTWLGIVQRGRRRRPKFDVAMWNVDNRVGDNLPRTNNLVEGWHRAFDKRMSVTHPTLGRLVSKLRKEQASTELMMEQLAMGVRMRKNKQYEVVNTRLQALVAMGSRGSYVCDGYFLPTGQAWFCVHCPAGSLSQGLAQEL
ncbi:hypothetical protein C0Q70_21795 [Pomacea canaliculata]|uniref:Uncharacterized protein n=1 Tax=Pomacea canaliculata TaxID=400727 RepID=A0A2T7NAN4_POMCA|nr:hypothetical protein C0Q70_21795 [Pomacea canaliculata]